MRNSTRTRKARERDGARHQAVASLATSPDHLRDCADASRTRSLTIYPIPREQGGIYDLQSAYPAERARLRAQHSQVVHLRGIGQRTYTDMIGATQPRDTGTPAEHAYGCVTHSPADGERYNERTLIGTRKGRKLVQAVRRERSIEIPSQYQAERETEQYGIEHDTRALGEQSERITIQTLTPGHYERQAGELLRIERTQPRIASSRVLASITDTALAADYCASERLQAALTRAAQIDRPHAGHPLDVPQRADSEIPSRRQIDDRSSKR